MLMNRKIVFVDYYLRVMNYDDYIIEAQQINGEF